MGARLLPYAVATLYLVFLFPSPEFPGYNADDGSWFVTLGWNLAEHGRYTSDTLPFASYGHHAAWPPLFPILLAGVIKLAGLNWVVLKLVMACCGLGALALLQRLWKEEGIGTWAVLLTALSPAFFLYSHHTMTEVPYIAAVAAALLGLSRAEDGRTAFLAGLLAVLAFFTRGYAVIFLPAGLLYFMLRPWPMRRRLVACMAYGVPMVIAILAWKGYTGHILATQPLDWITTRFGNGAGMLSDLLRPPMEYVQRLYWHELRYPAHFLLPVLPLEWVLRNDMSLVLSLPLLVVAGFGWLMLLRRRRGAVECWLPLALAFMMVPRSGAARYWLPFLPFLFYYLLHGAQEIRRRWRRLEGGTPVLPLAMLIMVCGALTWHLLDPDRMRFITTEDKNYRDIALWAGRHLPADAIVHAPFAHRFLAASGLHAFPTDRPTRHSDPQGLPLVTSPRYQVCLNETSLPQRTSCGEGGVQEIRIGAVALYRFMTH